MASILKDQEILFDGYRLTTTLNTVSLQYDVESQDDTTFGDDTRSNCGGLKIASVGFAGIFDADPTDSALFSAVGTSGKVLTVTDDSTEGNVAFTMQSLKNTLTPLQGNVGDIKGFEGSAVAGGSALIRGTLMAYQTGISSSGNGTAYNLGAIAAGSTMYVGIHIWNVDDGADTLILKVESDVADDFSGAETVRLTSSTYSAVQGEWLTLAGAVTDTWWRVTWPTVTGSTPSFNFAVAIGIL